MKNEKFLNRIKCIIISIFVLTLFNFYANANEIGNSIEIASKLQQLQNTNLGGTEYWFSIPPMPHNPSYNIAKPIKFFVLSQKSTEMNIEIGFSNISETIKLKANEVTELSYEMIQTSPIIYIDTTKLKISNIYKNSGVHITSKDPIIVYVIINFNYTTEGWLAIPNKSLGLEYIISSYTDLNFGTGQYSNQFSSLSSLTAIEDNTNISILIGGNKNTLINFNGKFYKNKDIINIKLNKGDVFLFMEFKYSYEKNGDITGTKIKSDKPISVIMGHQCAFIPTNNPSCNSLVEAAFPTETWSKTIFVPQVKNRKKPGIIRIVAKEKDTPIFKDGVLIDSLNQSWNKKDTNWLEMRIQPINVNPTPAVFSSTKPISITYFNSGEQEEQQKVDSLRFFDPFSLELVGIEHFQNNILFQAPKLINESKIENRIMMIYNCDSTGKIPNELIISKINDKNFTWKSLKSSDIDSIVVYKTKIDNSFYAMIDFAIPPGVYSIKSTKEKFICYSYGKGFFDGYGFQSFANLQKLNDITPTFECLDIDIKLCKVGQVKDTLITKFVNNIENFDLKVEDISFQGIDANSFKLKNTNFPLNLLSGQTLNLELEFTPSKVGIHQAEIVFVTNFETFVCSIVGIGSENQLNCGGEYFSYLKFDTTSNIYTYSDAKITSDSTVMLTESNSFQIGALSYKDKVSLENSFYMKFAFRFAKGDNDQFIDGSLEGADGIALLFQNNEEFKINQAGGYLGYNGLSKTIALEIDTYNNDFESNDPNGNHIALQIPNGDTVSTSHNNLHTLSINNNPIIIKPDSTIYFGLLIYDKLGQKLDFYLDTIVNNNNLTLSIKNFNFNNYLDLKLGEKAFIGFSSSTGNSFEEHEILNWEFCSEAPDLTSISDNNSESFIAKNNIFEGLTEYEIKSIKVVDILGNTIFKTNNSLFEETNNFLQNQIERGQYILIFTNNKNELIVKKLIF